MRLRFMSMLEVLSKTDYVTLEECLQGSQVPYLLYLSQCKAIDVTIFCG